MDETTLRRLAAQLLPELPTEIPYPEERAPVAKEINDALELPGGAARRALNGALSAHPAVRQWMREHGAAPKDEVRMWPLPGQSTSPRGLYYICPDGHTEKTLRSVPPQPPSCGECGAEMVRGRR